jgi:DNA-binding CsgD family transcriptional regulator/tetratricopeptide (TPR) repeat protein
VVLLAEQLVGRADELGALDQALAELGRGASTTVQIVGEPGIGKTRLLAELAARAEAHGHLVLAGSASEFERDLPFSVFVDALDEYVHGLEPARLASLDDETRAELAQVLPSLPAAAVRHTAPFGQERYRAHRAVRTLLELLATSRPVILALDDLHWADTGSVELVGTLLHRPPAAPVALALAMRPRQVPERLSAALERAHRAGTVLVIELGALTLAEVEELVCDSGGDRASATVLYEESGGNPFYVEELVRFQKRAGGAPPSGPAISPESVEVPSVVAAALTEELSLLSSSARAVLEGAAVAGDPFEPELAAAGAATSEESAIAALDELLQRDLLRPTDVPRRFRFRHPLVRRAVYDAAPGGWRLGAHQRCAELLATRGAAPALRAHHVERSAAQGDVAAVATLREAGDAAAHRTPASAAHWYAAALRLLSDNAPTEERVELLLARAQALSAIGAYGESHLAMLESIEMVPTGAVELHVRLTVACARIERLLGRHRQARDRLEQALAELPDPGSSLAVELMIGLAAADIYQMTREESLRWARRAVEAATHVGDPALNAAALAIHADSAVLAGAMDDARRSRDTASEIVAQLTDDTLATRLDVLVRLATAEFFLDRFEPAARHAERALAIGRATGQGDLHLAAYSILGFSLWMRGRLAHVSELLDDALEAARLNDNDHVLAWRLVDRSLAALAAGDLELALTTAEESWELTKDMGTHLASAAAAVTLAEVLYEMGEPERSVELIQGPNDEVVKLTASSWDGRAREILTRSLLATGRRAEAELAAAAASKRADEVGLPMTRAMAARAQAALALDDGRAEVAAELLLTAVVALDEVGDLYDAARTRVLAGRALVHAGENDRAAEELERAATAFEAFGAKRYRDEAEQELRKIGRTVYRRSARRAGDGALGELTRRELEVARLVVERMTNPQIAVELFLSQKTVETHLRNIFRKVGVANRVELARAVEAADRGD